MANALRRDPSRAAEAMARDRRAIELDPTNAFAYHSSGFFLLAIGHTDEAIRQLQRATQLDPLAKSAWTALGLAYAFARRANDAAVVARRVLAMDSTFGLAYLTLAEAHLVTGRADSAVRVLERLRVIAPQMPDYLSKLAFAYAVAGRWRDLERLGAELRRPGADPSGGVESAYTDFLLGDAEPLLRVLGSDAGGEYWQDRDLFGCNPLLDPVWADPRFAGVMKKWRQRPCPVAQQWPGVPRKARG
jgi:tetratricopeptide (TPR) repeat protein